MESPNDEVYDEIAQITIGSNVCYNNSKCLIYDDSYELDEPRMPFENRESAPEEANCNDNSSSSVSTDFSDNAVHDNVSIALRNKQSNDTPYNGSKKKCFTVLCGIAIVLALGLAAACSIFAFEIVTVRSEIASLSSQVTSNVESEIASLSTQVTSTLRSEISSLSSQMASNLKSEMNLLSNQITMLQQIISDELDNVSSSLQPISLEQALQQALQQALLLQQAYSAISDKLINASSLHQLTSLQQTLSTILYNISDHIEQLAVTSNTSYHQEQGEIFSVRDENYIFCSCTALPPSSPSGYYWVRASNGSAVRVYCDMTRSCGGVTGGWVRVAHLDMTNSSQQCPSGFNEHTNSDLRYCLKNGTDNCTSIWAPVPVNYKNVCGRVIAYQIGNTGGFRKWPLNSPYVDGVSLTAGIPKRHIWTFAMAHDEVESDGPSSSCPCIRGSHVTTIPTSVRNNFFCDTGSRDRSQGSMFYSNPAWDGAGCGPLSTCCSFNTPPWFYRQLLLLTSDDLEIRVCTNNQPVDKDIGIKIVELYVR